MQSESAGRIKRLRETADTGRGASQYPGVKAERRDGGACASPSHRPFSCGEKTARLSDPVDSALIEAVLLRSGLGRMTEGKQTEGLEGIRCADDPADLVHAAPFRGDAQHDAAES